LDFTHRQIRRITVMIQPPENPFHAELRKGIDAARKLVAALNIQIAVVQTRIDQPQDTARRILALPGQTDGLIIAAQDRPEIAGALMAIRAAVPVVTIVTDIEGSGRLAYIGPDDGL